MKDIRISLAAFYILTPVLTVARVLQQFYLIEADTGFYSVEGELAAKAISWSFVGMLAILLLLSLLAPKTCLAAPKKSVPLGCACFALAAALFFDSSMALVNISGGRLNLVVAVLALLSAVCFVMYGLSLVTDIKFPQFMVLFPVFWAIIDLISQFMRYRGQSQIIDYVISTVTMCLVLYTLLTHAKMVTGNISRRQSVIIVGIGLSTAFFCIINTVPTFIAMLMGKTETLIHDKAVATPTVFVMAIYLLVFIHSLKKAEPIVENAAVEETEEISDEISEAEEISEETPEITEE